MVRGGFSGAKPAKQGQANKTGTGYAFTPGFADVKSGCLQAIPVRGA